MRNGTKRGSFVIRGTEPLVAKVLRDQLGGTPAYRKGWDEALTFLFQCLDLDPKEIEDMKDMLAGGVLRSGQGRFSPDGPPLPLYARLDRIRLQEALHAVLADRLEEWAE